VNTNTQVMLFQTTKSEFNHNGCDLHFGNDGYLYMSMGDEGNQYNYHTNAQKLDKSLYAGLLRLDVDKRPGNLEPLPPQTASYPILTIPVDGNGKAYYSIPADNPFLGVTNLNGNPVDTTHLRGEFYAIGMRHCWRFSIDPVTGEIWAGIVGQDLYEEVDLVKKGGNYGWPYYEGTHLTVSLYGGAPTHPGLTNPPVGFVRDGPTWEYPHNSVTGADPAFAGLDVCGSLPYRGSRIAALTNAYLFGDFDTGGNIWALRRPTTNTVTVERLGGQTGLSAFGADPVNGDPLFCNYLQNKLQRLVVADTSGSTFPQKLSDTGIFADLGTLTPNPGIQAYEPNVTFWSDYAVKQRWFALPDATNMIGFGTDTNWTFPAGMTWVKHFDLEMERGNSATKKRIETRVVVRTTNGIYGVSYKWNATQDEAYLVGDSGDLFSLTITNGGVPQAQTWEIPSRSSCLTCHNTVAGYALSFNTRQLNRTNTFNGVTGNQIDLLASGGYFSSLPPSAFLLPAFAAATNNNYSLEYRVRSYLAVNCVQCHQPGGAGPPSWDARPNLTLAQTMLVNGIPVANDGGNIANKLVVPGDPNHSVVLLRLENTNGFSRMPPLATHALDPNGIALVQNWIANELPNHISYAQWLAQYPTLSGANTNSTSDPDGDGANNYLEYLTGTNPTNAADYWRPGIAANQSQVQVGYHQVPNVGVVIETSSDLLHWSTWNVPGNDPIYGLLSGTNVLVGTVSTNPPLQFFRAKVLEP
ncbi:MAG TPA: PQQ-dependent sugar dehydrogenase, partial [Verrucomicrobiae bacterium]